jgi:hypothetical protein
MVKYLKYSNIASDTPCNFFSFTRTQKGCTLYFLRLRTWLQLGLQSIEKIGCRSSCCLVANRGATWLDFFAKWLQPPLWLRTWLQLGLQSIEKIGCRSSCCLVANNGFCCNLNKRRLNEIGNDWSA